MPLTFRDEKGAPLTAAEVDANFRFVQEEIEDIEGNPPQANSISNVTATATTFSVHLQDGTIFGPFTLPTAMVSWRGEWQTDTGYFYLDLVYTLTQGVYLVLADHVSAADEFDPEAEESESALYHHVWGPSTAAQATVKSVGVDFYQPSLSEAGHYFRFVHPDGCTFLVPDDDTVAFPVGTELHLKQAASNPVTIDTDTSATINPYDGFINETGGLGRVVTLKKVGSNSWDIVGGLAEDASA